MKTQPKNGLSGEHVFTVGEEHVITFADGGMPAVLSTPKLVALIEQTAREALSPLLEPTQRTVGVELDLKHLAPTPPGSRVTIVTRVIHTEDRFVTFAVEARDEQEQICRGVHVRAVIEVESFARRVKRKSRAGG